MIMTQFRELKMRAKQKQMVKMNDQVQPLQGREYIFLISIILHNELLPECTQTYPIFESNLNGSTNFEIDES